MHFVGELISTFSVVLVQSIYSSFPLLHLFLQRVDQVLQEASAKTTGYSLLIGGQPHNQQTDPLKSKLNFIDWPTIPIYKHMNVKYV